METIYTVLTGSLIEDTTRFHRGFADSEEAVAEAKKLIGLGVDAFVGEDQTHWLRFNNQGEKFLVKKSAEDYRYPIYVWWTNSGYSLYKKRMDAGV